jgi:GT2 family glycosyltransferase
VVTAVIVAHDGATWLPRVIQALLDQTRPVQRAVAVDTGSRDRSGSVLASLLGQAVVFGMDRSTGYGAAVSRALQHRAANANIPGPSGPSGRSAGEQVEWVWLLHDDSEPAPDALEQLLRGAAETRSAAVLGPKLRDWADRQVILEAGITIDTTGRRITGIEPREVDQGQHDGDRDCLAVGSAGMLVRRDVWDSVGGFDPGMALFREDVDFCWRVHAAGYRVRVITDAVMFHVEASARRRRPISVARRPRQLDRRNAMLTLIGNLPAMPMLVSTAGNVAISILRALFFLFGKRLAAGLDELAAVGSVLGHPLRLLAMRRRRARGRRTAYGRLRRDLPPGRSLRRIAEFLASALSKSGQADTAGSHHATDDPDEADFLLTDTGLAQRILTNPGVLLFLGLTVIALVAERSLIGSGPLGGGELIPAWGGASGLWSQYLQGFHPVGIGSGSSAPPYLAIIAALATLLGGKPWLAIDVIMLGCVPLAGISAFLAVRRVTRSTPVRVWAAASYALLPVAMGAIAAGRIGTAAAFVLVPVIALLGGRMLTQPPRRARRAAWATGLAVTFAAAFVPLVWVVVMVAALAFVAVRPAMWRNLGIVAVVPPVLLLPWTIQAAANPSGLLLEIGVQQPGLAIHDLPARSLMLLSPGGPGLPPIWVTAGIAVAALAALLLSRRRGVMTAGWGIALSGMLVAVAVSRVMVTPTAGGPAVSAWPGVALLIAATGLLLAGVTAGEALPAVVAGGGGSRGDGPSGDGLSARPRSGTKGGRKAGSRSGRSPQRTMRGIAVAVLALAACSAPVLAAGTWLIKGVQGPVGPVSGPVVPAVVSVSANSGLQLRTLVLRTEGSQVSYSLQRDASPSLGDPDLAPVPAAQRALNIAVAALVAPNGGEAVDQGEQLSHFDIDFVLLPAPVDQGLARLLNGVAGLRPVSATPAFDLWRLTEPTARVLVVEPSGTVVPVPSGPIGVSGASVPAAGGTIELAEPSGGWSATLNGKPLTQVASSAGGWAQAFQLPAGGGVLSISKDQTGRDLILAFELLALIAVAILGLPGSRATAEDAAPAAVGSAAPAKPGSRARAMAGSGAAGMMAGAGVAAGARLAGDAADAEAAGPPSAPRARGRFGRAGRGSKRDRDATPRPRDRREGPGGPGRRPASGRPDAAGTSAGRYPDGVPGPPAPRPPDESGGSRPVRRAGWPENEAAGGQSGYPGGWTADDTGIAQPEHDGWSEEYAPAGTPGRPGGWPGDDTGAGRPGPGGWREDDRLDEVPGVPPGRRGPRPPDEAGAGRPGRRDAQPGGKAAGRRLGRRSARAEKPEDEAGGGRPGRRGARPGDEAGAGRPGRRGARPEAGAGRPGRRAAWPENEAAAGRPGRGWRDAEADAGTPAGRRAGWPGDDAGPGGPEAPWSAGEPAGGRRGRGAWPEDASASSRGAWPEEGGRASGQGRRAAWPEDEAAPRGPGRRGGWPGEESGAPGAPWPADESVGGRRGQGAWPENEAAGGRPGRRSAWPEHESAPGGPGQRVPWPDEPGGPGMPWPDEPAGPGAPWPADESGPAVSAPRSPSGTWPPADDGQPWASSPQDAWPAPPQQPSGWPTGRSETLDPLPPAAGRRVRRHGSQDEDDPDRWSVPEHDSGGDGW